MVPDEPASAATVNLSARYWVRLELYTLDIAKDVPLCQMSKLPLMRTFRLLSGADSTMLIEEESMLRGRDAPTAGAPSAYVKLAELKFVTFGMVTCNWLAATSQLGTSPQTNCK